MISVTRRDLCREHVTTFAIPIPVKSARTVVANVFADYSGFGDSGFGFADFGLAAVVDALV